MSNTEKADTKAVPEELPEPAKPMKRDYWLEAAIDATWAQIEANLAVGLSEAYHEALADKRRRFLEALTPLPGSKPN